MCNLYSMTKPQDAIRAIFRVVRDRTGNLPPMPGIFPDYPARIIRLANGDRELTTARWGISRFRAQGQNDRSRRYECAEHGLPALAALARASKPLHRPVHFILRI